MTLSERNAFFRVKIVFCALSALMILVASFIVVPVYSTMQENTRRPADFMQVFLSRFLNANYLAVHSSIIMVVLFSFVGIILIYSFFEQTSAPEILYIAFFTVSFAFEPIRLVFPLGVIYDIPSFYLLAASRVLIFARYFGLFSLFTASVCAAGLEVQKFRNILMIIFFASLVITFGAPIDTQVWDTGLNVIRGYTFMFTMIEIVIFVTTVAGFFVAVNVRSSKEYTYIGIGVALALIGRGLLLRTDNWACPVPGIFLLSFGTWLICSKLHKIHLWL